MTRVITESEISVNFETVSITLTPFTGHPDIPGDVLHQHVLRIGQTRGH